MKIIDLKGNGRLRTERGRTELDVPHLGKTLTYVLPLIGPTYHQNAMFKIDSQNLYRPTTAHVISLVDVALQNLNDPHCADIYDKFRTRYLWTGTEITFFSEGIFVYDDIDGKMPNNSKLLIKLFNTKDKRVRLVSPGFKTGFMPVSKFLEHPYVIAQVGEEMIETTERVARARDKKIAHMPEIKNKSDYETTPGNFDIWRETAVNLDWGGRFNLNCFSIFNGEGYAFGKMIGLADKK